MEFIGKIVSSKYPEHRFYWQPKSKKVYEGAKAFKQLKFKGVINMVDFQAFKMYVKNKDEAQDLWMWLYQHGFIQMRNWKLVLKMNMRISMQ